MSEERSIWEGLRINMAAALYEMQFWLGIMTDHAAMIRQGLDPSEKSFFNEANHFTMRMQELHYEANSINPEKSDQINELIDRTIPQVEQLAYFKRELYGLTRECKVLIILPADVLDHVRREADFFLGVLNFALGEPTPLKRTIGIPDSDEEALTVPRLMIPEVTEQKELALEESLFWLRQNMEHAQVLSLYFRPELQHALFRKTKRYQNRLTALYNQALAVNKSHKGLERLLRDSKSLTTDWRDFVQNLFDDVTNCRVPTGQTNIWPSVDEHFIREADYFLEVLNHLD